MKKRACFFMVISMLMINTLSYAYCRLTMTYYHNYGTATSPNLGQISYSLEDDFATVDADGENGWDASKHAEVGYEMTSSSVNVQWAGYMRNTWAEPGSPTSITLHTQQGYDTFCLYGISNWDYYMKIRVIAVDTIAPTTTIAWNEANGYLTGRAVDLGTGVTSYAFYKEGTSPSYIGCSTNYSSTGATFTFQPTTSGRWYFVARDAVGHISLAANVVVTISDSTPPIIGSISPAQYLNSTAGTTASITASSISDEGQGLSKIQCWYRFLPAGSSTWGAWVQNTAVNNTSASYTYSCPITSGDGRYQVAIRAIDRVENYGDWVYTDVYLDKTPPTVGTITMKYYNSSGDTYISNTLTNRNVYFSLNNGSDNYSNHKSTTYALYKNNVIVASAGTVATTLTETGTYKIIVTTTDNYGNTSNSGEYMIRIDKTPPTIATLEMRYINSSGALYPGGVTTNKNVYVALRGGSDTEGSITNSYTVNSVTSGVTSQTFNSTGTYSIVVITTDEAGNQAVSDPYIVDVYKIFKVSININNILDNLIGVATVNVYLKESSSQSYGNAFETFNNPATNSSVIAIKENVPEGIYDIKVECIDRVGNISQRKVENYVIE